MSSSWRSRRPCAWMRKVTLQLAPMTAAARWSLAFISPRCTMGTRGPHQWTRTCLTMPWCPLCAGAPKPALPVGVPQPAAETMPNERRRTPKSTCWSSSDAFISSRPPLPCAWSSRVLGASSAQLRSPRGCPTLSSASSRDQATGASSGASSSGASPPAAGSASSASSDSGSGAGRGASSGSGSGAGEQAGSRGLRFRYSVISACISTDRWYSCRRACRE
mmetsp:Transcript_30511/g.90528  ORF Transcript_30511/g.90528 Transcript_30511/m.90528 type:complete len:220 (-) Transcript_30511:408-1067(-)